MKGTLGGRKGFLLPYQEVVKKLNLPSEYILEDLEYCGGEIILHMVKKEDFISLEGETASLKYEKRNKRYRFLKKGKFEETLGIKSELPLLSILLRKEGKLQWDYANRLLAMAALGREHFVWIREGNPIEDAHRANFVEKDW